MKTDLTTCKHAADGDEKISPSAANLAALNEKLASLSATERVAWAHGKFGAGLALSSSFGIQSAVMLHLATRVVPDIPVILIDTGYLFPETYRFIDMLTARLRLNLKIHRAELSPAWQEARFGKLWEQGVAGLERYNQLNKVEPMRHALEELSVSAWLAGLRREQSASRHHLPIVSVQRGRYKIHPIIELTNKQVHDYLTAHDLPYHPLWEQGYVSVGDTHTTVKWEPGMTEEQTRFFGLKRECGLHEQ
ncbi:MAG: phosphoadenylyl-sulfate reductase [Verrucomicrobiales bacterium]|jgi:phosphoadenosine phosphosulfate reductase|nr:phosphoadenylyl-sulfate reductase [Verrucomicrobiales bacterium]